MITIVVITPISHLISRPLAQQPRQDHRLCITQDTFVHCRHEVAQVDIRDDRLPAVWRLLPAAVLVRAGTLPNRDTISGLRSRK